MVGGERDRVSEAIRLLADVQRASDTEEEIRKLEAVVDLLDEHVGTNPPLDEDARRRIKNLRASCTRRLLASLSDVRGRSTEQWLDCVRILLHKMKPEAEALQEAYRRNAALFPRPLNGATVRISPPGLAWLPLRGATHYRVEICGADGALVYQKTIGADPIHRPDRVLPPSTFTWDVIALDAQGNDLLRRGEMSFTIEGGAPALPWIEPDALLARVPAEHSRFLYIKRDLPSIRATLETTRKQNWRACLHAAERALATPAPRYPEYHLTEDKVQSLLEYRQYTAAFRRCVDGALMDLSLAFLVTDEKKYADAAKRILLEVADWPTDDSDVMSVSARWGDEPGLSLARCGHRAYDWLYDALSDQERALVLAMCEARAWQTYRRLFRCDYLAYPGESHNGRLIAYLAEMAIVMAGESQGAITWLEYSLKALATVFPHWGGYEGGWAEGTAYGLWYNMRLIPTLEALYRATGLVLWRRPFYQNVRYFFFYCTALRGKLSPFGDGAEKVGPGTSGGGGYAPLLWYYAHRFDDRYMGWWVSQIDDWHGGSGELALLFEDSAEATPPTGLPGSRVFHGVGWAALHSNLSQPNEDTFLLFKSSPYGSVSHSHADQNAFCIMKGGRALAIPSGYYGPSVGMPHHSEWAQSTKSNNCVLVDMEGQTTGDRKAAGRIMAFEDRQGYSYVSGDAAAAYGGRVRRFERHILFLRPGLFLLLDHLETLEPAQFQWMLHALERMDVDSAAGRVVSRHEGATLDVRLRSPGGLSLRQTDRFDTSYNAGIPKTYHQEVPKQWHLTAETVQRASSVRVGAVLAVWGPRERLELDVLGQRGWFGARARGPFGNVEGWLQLRPHAAGPAGYGRAVAEGRALLCGRSAADEIFVGS